MGGVDQLLELVETGVGITEHKTRSYPLAIYYGEDDLPEVEYITVYVPTWTVQMCTSKCVTKKKCTIRVCMVSLASSTASTHVTGKDSGRAPRTQILGRSACLVLCLQSLPVEPRFA